MSASRRHAMAILGGGRLAVRVAQLLQHTGVAVRLWARREETRASLAAAFKGVPVAGDVGEACEGARGVRVRVEGRIRRAEGETLDDRLAHDSVNDTRTQGRSGERFSARRREPRGSCGRWTA